MSPAAIAPEAMELLTGFSWPGNGREVRNVIESAMICGGDTISVQDLPINIKHSQMLPQEALAQTDENPTVTPVNGSGSVDYRINSNISQREVHLIITTLEKYKDIALACGALGVSRATFYRKCKAHGITPSNHI
jgi:transcriptional regulator with PAS, ATPase and Fis domain